MFSDNQAQKSVGKKWRIILPVTKCFTDEFYADYVDFIFPSDKVTLHGSRHH